MTTQPKGIQGTEYGEALISQRRAERTNVPLEDPPRLCKKRTGESYSLQSPLRPDVKPQRFFVFTHQFQDRATSSKNVGQSDLRMSDQRTAKEGVNYTPPKRPKLTPPQVPLPLNKREDKNTPPTQQTFKVEKASDLRGDILSDPLKTDSVPSPSSDLRISSEESSDQWVERYRPKKSSEVFGNTKNVSMLKSWVRERRTRRPTKHLVTLLHGPPGIGKTSMAHAILREEGYHVYEINASLVRTSKAIQQELLDIVPRVTLKGPSAVVLDEIDGGSGTNNDETEGDKGAVEGVLEFIKWSKTGHRPTQNWAPIICIANEVSSKSMQKLVHGVQTLRFFRPYPSDLSKVLNRVVRGEKLTILEKDKVKLIESSGGDVRRLVGLLEHYAIAGPPSSIKKFTETSAKDSFYDIFKAITHLFYHPTFSFDQSINTFQSDQSIMTLIMQENYPRLFEHKWPDGQSAPHVAQCAHGKPKKSCDKCLFQCQTLDNMADMADRLSMVDHFESVVPVYREDQEDARGTCAGLLISSIRHGRGRRHLGVEDPEIKFTSFYTNRSKTQTTHAQLQYFGSHTQSDHLLNSMDTMDYVECLQQMKSQPEWNDHQWHYGIPTDETWELIKWK